MNAQNMQEFVTLLTRHQQSVHLFIRSLLPNRVDADDVLQNTNLVLWKKFDQFESGSNFRAWAFRIAYLEVRSFLSRQSRDYHIFSDDFMQKVAATAIQSAGTIDSRQIALTDCLARLSDKDRDLIRRRYSDSGTAAAVAKEVGRSIDAVYKALARIRLALEKCINRKLADEGAS